MKYYFTLTHAQQKATHARNNSEAWLRGFARASHTPAHRPPHSHLSQRAPAPPRPQHRDRRGLGFPARPLSPAHPAPPSAAAHHPVPPTTCSTRLPQIQIGESTDASRLGTSFITLRRSFIPPISKPTVSLFLPPPIFDRSTCPSTTIPLDLHPGLHF